MDHLARGLVLPRGAPAHLFGELVGADAEGIALVPATSYGFAVAARNLALKAGERVAVRRVAGQTWTEAILEILDERISVVSVHWTDGALIDLVAISDRSHEIGARLIIDGSQSIGVIPLDVAALRPDLVVTVGHKWLLGPVGVGTSTLRSSIARANRWSRTGSCERARRTSLAWSTTATRPTRGTTVRRRARIDPLEHPAGSGCAETAVPQCVASRCVSRLICTSTKATSHT
jgi:kynureninase